MGTSASFLYVALGLWVTARGSFLALQSQVLGLIWYPTSKHSPTLTFQGLISGNLKQNICRLQRQTPLRGTGTPALLALGHEQNTQQVLVESDAAQPLYLVTT